MAGKSSKQGGGKSNRSTPYNSISDTGRRQSSAAHFSSEETLINALRTRIDVPIFGTDTLRRYLEDANWVVDVAYEVFIADYEAVHAAATPFGPTNGPTITITTSSNVAVVVGDGQMTVTNGTGEMRTTLPAKIRGVPVVIHINREEQRREAARLLRKVINIGRDPSNQIQITLSEVVLTLLVTEWDVEAAAARWEQPNIIRWQLHKTFDRLRPQAEVQVDMDERLARLVQVTGRDDWYSLQKFLETHNHRFIDAIMQWYLRGIPVEHPSGWDDSNRLYFGRRIGWGGKPLSPMPTDAKALPMTLATDLWPPMETTFRPSGSPLDEADAQPPMDLCRGPLMKNKPPGFCLMREGDEPDVGAVVPPKFVVDYIKKGKYRANEFEWQKYFWPNLPQSVFNDPNNPPFDWDRRNPCIQHLGKWRRQQYFRIEHRKKKKTPQGWSREELDYLFELCQRHLKELMEAHSDKARKDFMPLSFRDGSTSSLEKAFNKHFLGKKPGGAARPRHFRKGNSLKVKASREKRFQEAFGFQSVKMPKIPPQQLRSSGLPGNLAHPTPIGSGSFRPLVTPSAAETAAKHTAIAVRVQNMQEEDDLFDIDTRADEMADQLRSEARSNAGKETLNEGTLQSRVQELLVQHYINSTDTHMRAAFRRIMRGFGMIVPDEEPAEEDTQVGSMRQQGARAQRARNMAKEDAVASIEFDADAHRCSVRTDAEQQLIDSGMLPTNAQILERVRLILHTQFHNSKNSADHLAIIRRVMRDIGMVVPGEEDNEVDEQEDPEIDEAEGVEIDQQKDDSKSPETETKPGSPIGYPAPPSTLPSPSISSGSDPETRLKTPEIDGMELDPDDFSD